MFIMYGHNEPERAEHWKPYIRNMGIQIYERRWKKIKIKINNMEKERRGIKLDGRKEKFSIYKNHDTIQAK